MLNQPTLSEQIIMCLSETIDALDYPKSFSQVFNWQRQKSNRHGQRLYAQEKRQRKRIKEALRRLEKAELLSFDKQAAGYGLRPQGWLRYLYYYSRQAPAKSRRKIKQHKYLIIFDIPEDFRKFRDLFRSCLRNRGCAFLQKSVFVCPDKETFAWAQKVTLNCGLERCVKFIIADKIL